MINNVRDARRLDTGRGSMLAQLMAVDGLEMEAGTLAESSWRAFVADVATRLGIAPGRTVFEVGCGGGAFLYDLYERGITVAGIDKSTELVGYARQAMPRGTFDVADAASLDTSDQYDVVLACSVFLYFPSLTYASNVIERMAAKARFAVALLDMPDAAREAEAAMLRRRNGPSDGETRNSNLPLLYFERAWMVDALSHSGMRRVEITDQRIAGYASSMYRVNAFGFKR
jgi:trans-aconitate methyltransferase